MTRIPAASALAFASILAIQQTMHAADFTWQGASGNWSDSVHWVGGMIPVNDPATHVFLPGTDPTNQVYTLDAARPVWQVNGLTFQLTPAQLNISPGTALQFTGTNPFVEMPIGFSESINGPVILDSVVKVNGGGRTLSFAGPISGPGGLRYEKTGTLALSGSNTFAGGVIMNATGILASQQWLILSGPEALGSGPLTINRGSSNIPIVQLGAQPGLTTTLSQGIIINSTDPSLSTFSALLADGASPGHTMTVSSLTVNGNTFLELGVTPATTSDVQWNLPVIQLAGTLQLGGVNLASYPLYQGSITISSIQSTSTSALNVTQNITVRLTGASNYSGGTAINFGAVIADAPNSLGTGPITLTNTSTLTLNATNAAANTITGTNSQTFYNANGAAGGHIIQQTDLFLGPAVTTLSNGSVSDTLINLSGLHGTGAMLATLDRGIGSGTTPTVSFQPRAIVENTNGALPTVQNLGTNADLILGLGQPSALPVTLGTGTPWLGLNATAYRGTVTANGDIELQGKYVNGTDSSFQIAASGAPVNVTLSGNLSATLANYAGVLKFIATSTSQLSADNALGGGGATSTVPIDIPNTTNLTVLSSAAINGPASFHGGSKLTIQAPGLTGTGVLSRDSAALTVVLADPAALTGPQLAGFIHAGDTVQLAADTIQQLDTLNPAVKYFIPSGTVSLSGTMNLNGGSLSLQNTITPGVALVPAPGSDFVIEVGALGATFSGGRIGARIHALGDISVKNVLFDHSGNQFQGVNVVNGSVSFASPAAATGATLNLTGAQFTLAGSGTSTPTQYDNRINILTNSTMSSNSSLPQGPVTLTNLWLGTSTLTLGAGSLTITSLTLSGNGALVGPATLVNIGQDGATPRNLVILHSTTGQPTSITGSVTSTGSIALDGDTIINGTVSPAATTFSVELSATLAGTGIIHRPVSMVLSPKLSPGTINNFTSLPGTLTVDSLVLNSTTTLLWDLGQPGVIGGPANDLVDVAGNITFDGILAITPGPGFAPGHYTLFTYGGTLSNLGVTLPTLSGYSLALDFTTAQQVGLNVAAVPEPGSVAVLGAAGLLWRRRRRSR